MQNYREDKVLEVITDQPGFKRLRVERDGKEIVITDLYHEYNPDFQPTCQIAICSAAGGYPVYEIWLDGEFYTNYGSK